MHRPWARHEANGHAAFEVDGSWRAHNPGQRWVSRFDGRGFSVEPDAGGWAWGMELQSYGFAGQERVIAGPVRVNAEGRRVAYPWSAALQEWYLDDARGLAHGYTVRERPTEESGNEQGPLILTLGLRGDLRPTVHSDARSVTFADADGAGVLTYSGLVAFDADGEALPAGFEVVVDRLRITVDERGARYPLTIDPIAQHAYLKASNTEANDQFGHRVAASDDTVVVSASGEDSSATGVNGNQSDNGSSASGAAYVFVRSGVSWSQQAYLKASNTEATDVFGSSVSVSGDTVVVGAGNEDSSATGVNGNQASNGAPFSGAAYVFVRNGTTWSQQAYLKASNTGADDAFGASVSVSGDTVVVGAPLESSNATGVNGDQANDSAAFAGAVYVFVRSGTTWRQQAYLKAFNTGPGDRFGWSVSVSGDTLVVGALEEDSQATGVNGDGSDDSAANAGAAYVFVRSGTTWSQQAYLKASNTDGGDGFGETVSASGATVVVGAAKEDSSATGVNGDQANNGAADAGAVYVFARSGTTWSQEAYVKASNTDQGDVFGTSLSLSGGTLLVGAHGERSNATGVNGNQSDDSAAFAGAAYRFRRNGTTWSQQAYLKASNTEVGDFFGFAVSVSGANLVVSALGEDSSATGVNGNQMDNGLVNPGAAYVFGIAEPETYCAGKTNSLGCVPFLTTNGVPSVTDTDVFQIVGNHHVPTQFGVLLYGFGKANLNFHGGKLCVKGVTRLPAKGPKAATSCVAGAGATLTRNFNATIQSGSDPSLTAGATVYAQWLQRDPSNTVGGFGDNLTNGVSFTVAP